jgi:uncharacterized membrane protein YccF (DUF307 family)
VVLLTYPVVWWFGEGLTSELYHLFVPVEAVAGLNWLIGGIIFFIAVIILAIAGAAFVKFSYAIDPSLKDIIDKILGSNDDS